MGFLIMSINEFEEEEEYDPELEQILREAEEANKLSYVFDPDIEEEEEAEFDPGYYMRKGRRVWSPRVGRKRRRTTRRKPTRRKRVTAYLRRRYPRLRRYYARARKKLSPLAKLRPILTPLLGFFGLLVGLGGAHKVAHPTAGLVEMIKTGLGRLFDFKFPKPATILYRLTSPKPENHHFGALWGSVATTIGLFIVRRFLPVRIPRGVKTVLGWIEKLFLAFSIGVLISALTSPNPNGNPHSTTETSTSTHDPFNSAYR